MGMTIDQIDEWVARRLRPDGQWTSAQDVLDCLFVAMEDMGPCCGQWDRQPTVQWSYIHLIEIGCECLRDTTDLVQLGSFLHRVLVIEIGYLTDTQKRRFAEQLAWLLNLATFTSMIDSAITSLGSLMPDRDTVCQTWKEARAEYKRRHPQ